MQKPSYCPPATYNLMRECWRLEASLRPSFRGILHELNNQLKDITQEDYLALSISSHHIDTPPSSYGSDATSIMLPSYQC